MQDGRDDAGRTVRRCGDHAAARGVLLVDGERVEGDPVDRAQRVVLVGSDLEPLAQGGGAPAHLQPAREHPCGARPALHTFLHHRPDVQQPGPHLLLGAAGDLVGEHDVADARTGLAGAPQ